jgi:hypothetical protein
MLSVRKTESLVVELPKLDVSGKLFVILERKARQKSMTITDYVSFLLLPLIGLADM